MGGTSEEVMRGKPGESTLSADKKFSNTNFFLEIQNYYNNIHMLYYKVLSHQFHFSWLCIILIMKTMS